MRDTTNANNETHKINDSYNSNSSTNNQHMQQNQQIIQKINNDINESHNKIKELKKCKVQETGQGKREKVKRERQRESF